MCKILLLQEDVEEKLQKFPVSVEIVKYQQVIVQIVIVLLQQIGVGGHHKVEVPVDVQLIFY